MQLDKAIRERKSVRRFLDKKPNWRKIIKAIDLARFAPCAGNQFVLKFILVRDADKIKKLRQACQQDFLKGVKYAVVAVSDDAFLEKNYNERGHRYARQQAGAAIENFLLALEDQGLATCWIGHFDDNGVKEALGIPDALVVEALFPIGKETKVTESRDKNPKQELENILYFDKWKNKYMTPADKVSISSV